jgi:hypothetical protein
MGEGLAGNVQILKHVAKLIFLLFFCNGMFRGKGDKKVQKE